MSGLILNSDGIDRLFQQATKLIDAQQFSSIEWSMSQHNNVISAGAQSVAQASLPQDPPIYRIYSMTKPIVSFVAMQLIDTGKLKLDDALSQYIPAMANVQVRAENGSLVKLERAITIEHLLTHTAGFSYDFMPDCPVATMYREAQISSLATRPLAEVIGMLTTLPLASQPGDTWRYSVATDVLAHVLENVTGLSLPELLNLHVFEPLGMHDTAFFVPENKTDRLLPMYGSRELGEVMLESTEPNTLNVLDVSATYPANEGSGFYRGGHGLFSTLNDYQKFMHVLQTGESADGKRMISADGFDLMWADRIDSALKPLVLGFTIMSGYGWNLMGRVMQDPVQCEYLTAVGEGGWSGAASTYFWIDRDNGISGIAMGQYIGSTARLGVLMQHAGYGMFKPSA